MGHLLISCGRCHDQLRSTTFYEPPHDIRHRRAGPWRVVLVLVAPAAAPSWRVSNQLSNNRH